MQLLAALVWHMYGQTCLQVEKQPFQHYTLVFGLRKSIVVCVHVWQE